MFTVLRCPQDDVVTLGIVGGRVEFLANPGDRTVTLKTQRSDYADDQWHFVKVTQERRE